MNNYTLILPTRKFVYILSGNSSDNIAENSCLNLVGLTD